VLRLLAERGISGLSMRAVARAGLVNARSKCGYVAAVEGALLASRRALITAVINATQPHRR
jgi:hypothetical protein